jgi:hypothetical protein
MELVGPDELRECIPFIYEVEQDTGSIVLPLPHIMFFLQVVPSC